MNCELSCLLEVQNPSMGDVPETLSHLMGFLRDHGVTDEQYLQEFELAAAEAINNATEHGCVVSSKSFVRVKLILKEDRVELRVTDPSQFNGHTGRVELPDDPLADGGRGLFIMDQMCDQVSHEKENGYHVVILRKNFATRKWGYLPGRSDQVVSEMAEEVITSYELINTLLSLSEWLASAPDITTFIDGALEKICTVIGSDSAYVKFSKKENLFLTRSWGRELKSPLANLEVVGSGVEAQAARTGKEILINASSLLSEDDPLSGLVHDAFIVPIIFKDEVLGILVTAHTEGSPFVDAWKLKVVRMVAEYIGVAVTVGELQMKRTSERLALRDLEIASEIQLSLMPHDFSSVRGLDLYGVCKPALQAGGDYFDYFLLPDGSILMAIADVMGKGLPAAILATMLRTNLHAVVASKIYEPNLIIAKINSLMIRDLIKLQIFITMTCAVISPDRREIVNSSAGHHSSVLQGADGKITQLEGTGLPLGIFPDSTYTAETIPFLLGDRLLLFTDGITEAMDDSGAMFEFDRIRESLTDSRGISSQAALLKLLSDVSTFSGSQKQSDDLTALLISRIS